MTWEILQDEVFGKIETPARDEIERESVAFMLGEMIKQGRKQAKMSQEDLAIKSGTKKSYISRIEKGRSDIQLQTLFRIIENGLERKLSLSIL